MFIVCFCLFKRQQSIPNSMLYRKMSRINSHFPAAIWHWKPSRGTSPTWDQLTNHLGFFQSTNLLYLQVHCLIVIFDSSVSAVWSKIFGCLVFIYSAVRLWPYGPDSLVNKSCKTEYIQGKQEIIQPSLEFYG